MPKGLMRGVGTAVGRAVDQVDAGCAKKSGHKFIRRLVVELHRRTELLDPPLVEDRDPVPHGHGLHLIVGDINHGGAQLLVQAG